jgi:hypothetical protein
VITQDKFDKILEILGKHSNQLKKENKEQASLFLKKLIKLMIEIEKEDCHWVDIELKYNQIMEIKRSESDY